MKVNYINSDFCDDVVRCTFVGRDAIGKTRRPVIDLDVSDLGRLVELAKEFRRRQRALAAKYAARAKSITDAGVAE